jgi:hypothetical protein
VKHKHAFYIKPDAYKEQGTTALSLRRDTSRRKKRRHVARTPKINFTETNKNKESKRKTKPMIATLETMENGADRPVETGRARDRI